MLPDCYHQSAGTHTPQSELRLSFTWVLWAMNVIAAARLVISLHALQYSTGIQVGSPGGKGVLE